MGMEFTVWVFKHVKIFFSILQPAFMFVCVIADSMNANIYLLFFFCEEITQIYFAQLNL